MGPRIWGLSKVGEGLIKMVFRQIQFRLTVISDRCGGRQGSESSLCRQQILIRLMKTDRLHCTCISFCKLFRLSTVVAALALKLILWPLTKVPHMSLISNNFCPEATGQTEVKSRYMLSLHESRGPTFTETIEVTWPRWPRCPYMVKPFKSIFLKNWFTDVVGIQH